MSARFWDPPHVPPYSIVLLVLMVMQIVPNPIVSHPNACTSGRSVHASSIGPQCSLSVPSPVAKGLAKGSVDLFSQPAKGIREGQGSLHTSDCVDAWSSHPSMRWTHAAALFQQYMRADASCVHG